MNGFAAIPRALALAALLFSTVPAPAADQVTTRTIDQLKQEIIDRTAHKPQRSPAEGVDPADVRAAVSTIKTLDRDEWARGFMRVADKYFEVGKQAQAAGDAATAKANFLRAFRLYKIAHYPTNNSPEKQKAYEKGIEAFLAYASYFDPKLEVIRIPFEGKEIIGYLRKPKAQGKVPLVFISTALDGRKEEAIERNDELLAAGIAVFAVDMPGTGQAPIKADVHSESMLLAALDYLAKRPDIDASRIGYYGGSWSGYWAVKMGIVARDRLKAVVAQGPPVHFYFQPAWQRIALNTPEYLMDLLPARAMVYQVHGLDAFLAYGPRMSLKAQGLLDKPSAPMLLIDGVEDTQVPIDDLMLVARTVPGGIKETWINPDGGHMGADKQWGAERIRKEIVTPWLIKKLKGRG
jgi:pimeloyl-ACP methyl ester carboxylesterase